MSTSSFMWQQNNPQPIQHVVVLVTDRRTVLFCEVKCLVFEKEYKKSEQCSRNNTNLLFSSLSRCAVSPYVGKMSLN